MGLDIRWTSVLLLSNSVEMFFFPYLATFHTLGDMQYFFFNFYAIFFFFLLSAQWTRWMLGVERRASGEFRGNIREDANEREQILIRQISLLPWCMSAPTLMAALHGFLLCSGLNTAKGAVALSSAPRKPASRYSSDGQRTWMFHRLVSVHINRSAHEIFKIFLFIEIFNTTALFMLQESAGGF